MSRAVKLKAISSVSRPLAAALVLLGAAVISNAQAQTCGTDYVVKEGDSLAQIAGRVYGKVSQWTIIFYANQDRLGNNASLMVPGQAIRIPCIAGTSPPQERRPEVAATETPSSAPRPAPFALSTMVNRIEFLTADGDPPFTGRALQNGGMLTHVLTAAMDLIKEESKGKFGYGVSWVNDWSAHLSPLLVTRAFDVGFPWLRPDCENLPSLDEDSKARCQKFFFSDPLQEVITLAFVRKDSPIDPSDEGQIVGRTVCRPAKYGVPELDQGGRNWVKDGKITLIRAQSSGECFRLLDNGSVEVVVASELAGRADINSLGIADRVRISDRPLAIGTLHAIVAKTHPHSRTMLYYINSALSRLRESGEYDRIVEAHFQRYWESLGVEPNAAIAPPPAPPAAPSAPQPPAERLQLPPAQGSPDASPTAEAAAEAKK